MLFLLLIFHVAFFGCISAVETALDPHANEFSLDHECYFQQIWLNVSMLQHTTEIGGKSRSLNIRIVLCDRVQQLPWPLTSMPVSTLSLHLQSNERFDEVINDAAFKSFIFRLRTKMETYNVRKLFGTSSTSALPEWRCKFQDENRLKTSVVSITPVNYVEYTQKLLKDIADLEKSL